MDNEIAHILVCRRAAISFEEPQGFSDSKQWRIKENLVIATFFWGGAKDTGSNVG